MARRKIRVGQKIEMIKIEKGSNPLVSSFPKRWLNLTKMTSKMCFHTQAGMAFIVCSPKANIPYFFGSPSFQSVINCNRYQNPGSWPNTTANEIFSQPQTANINKLTQELMFLEEKLKQEQCYGQRLDQIINEQMGKYLLEVPIEGLNVEQLKQLQIAIQNLRNKTINLQNLFAIVEAQKSFHQTNMVTIEPNVTNPFGGVVGYSSFLSSTITSGISVDGSSLTTMSETNFNQMLLFDSAPTGLGVSQFAAFPPINNGGISINGASWSTMAGSSSNQIANLGAVGMVNALEYAGSSRINMASNPSNCRGK